MTAATTKILIVDDEPDIRGLLSFTFEQAGYVVKTAANGCDAVALCSDEAFDVVLSDITMPEMSGHELSGFDPGNYGCASSPRYDFIPKPFRPEQVVSFVKQVLAA
jgi:Response regulator receiver domain